MIKSGKKPKEDLTEGQKSIITSRTEINANNQKQTKTLEVILEFTSDHSNLERGETRVFSKRANAPRDASGGDFSNSIAFVLLSILNKSG